MPRPQRELDPNGGALVKFARDLRALREQAGSPKFATMERRVGRSKSTLAEAAGGQHLPRWDTVADFVRACEADPAPWRPRWEQLRRELDTTPGDTTPDDSPPNDSSPGDGLTGDGPVSSPETDSPDGLVVPEQTRDPAAEPRSFNEPGLSSPPVAAPAGAPALSGSSDSASEATSGDGERRAIIRRWPGRHLLLTAATTAVVFGVVGIAIGRATGPEVAGPSIRAIEVQNKVALGPNLLIEDRTPSYLSTIPIAYCAATDRGCKVAGTEMGSGSAVVAHCVTHGQQMYNYNLAEVAAASNPDRSSSDLWYRASYPDGRAGFISEVYLTASSRGGLGLPDCGPDVARAAATSR